MESPVRISRFVLHSDGTGLVDTFESLRALRERLEREGARRRLMTVALYGENSRYVTTLAASELL
jgi:hypothetical protein